jgi:DNA-binding NarL/FixJ family response regulator
MSDRRRNGNRSKVRELTAEGWSAKQIGEALNISPSTVYAHRHQMRKVNERKAETDSRRVERAAR